MTDFRRALVAEALGTAFLLAIVVGSGIMAETLSGGNVAISLLANSTATGAGLFVLVTIFGPLSGAHFNPAVTLVFLLRGAIGLRQATAYVGAQVTGAIGGVVTAHLMFGLPALQVGATARAGGGLYLAEAVAAFGLILAILGTLRARPDAVAAVVGFYIAAAYWFTASTSFANPAATIARAMTGTFTGIVPVDVPAFIAAQLAGAGLGVLVGGQLFDAGPTPDQATNR